MVNILNDVSVSSIKIFIALLSMRQVVDILVKEKKKKQHMVPFLIQFIV